jgi:hypothetical protein
VKHLGIFDTPFCAREHAGQSQECLMPRSFSGPVAGKECGGCHPRAPVVARMRVADHRAAAVIDLRLFGGRRQDDGASLGAGAAAQLADEAPDARVAGGETVVIDQILVNRLGIASLAEREFDEIAEGLAGARAGTATGRRTGAGVGGHLVGRF